MVYARLRGPVRLHAATVAPRVETVQMFTAGVYPENYPNVTDPTKAELLQDKQNAEPVAQYLRDSGYEIFCVRTPFQWIFHHPDQDAANALRNLHSIGRVELIDNTGFLRELTAEEIAMENEASEMSKRRRVGVPFTSVCQPKAASYPLSEAASSSSLLRPKAASYPFVKESGAASSSFLKESGAASSSSMKESGAASSSSSSVNEYLVYREEDRSLVRYFDRDHHDEGEDENKGEDELQHGESEDAEHGEVELEHGESEDAEHGEAELLNAIPDWAKANKLGD